jgi:hypothetical protein
MMSDPAHPSSHAGLELSNAVTQGRQISHFLSRVVALHQTLSQLSNLSPSKAVNALFRELVSLCTQTLSTSVTERARPPPHFPHL